ncbi:uncharacterized protein LOC132188145 [Corylus avellana]|uniref:uncharacterized protein LOC132188145 n=1 Tax=Corylus avellana TaxID=13451 RepID=UPI00286C973F|nr:uncharacterized protein LOC132188145 [Corylus avellana]
MEKKEKKGSKAVMEAEKRRLLRDREPLSDSTNLTTTAARATRKPNLSSIFTKSLPGTNPSANLTDANDFRNPSSASTPSRQAKASSAHVTGDREVPEPCSVYSRRETAHKKKGNLLFSDDPELSLKAHMSSLMVISDDYGRRSQSLQVIRR